MKLNAPKGLGINTMTLEETKMTKKTEVQANFADAWALRNRANPFVTNGPADGAALGVQGLADVSTVAKRDSFGRVIKSDERREPVSGITI